MMRKSHRQPAHSEDSLVPVRARVDIADGGSEVMEASKGRCNADFSHADPPQAGQRRSVPGSYGIRRATQPKSTLPGAGRPALRAPATATTGAARLPVHSAPAERCEVCA